MILLWFIIILFVGGILAWIAEYWNASISRWISMLALIINFCLASYLLAAQNEIAILSESSWLLYYRIPWIPSFGISFYLALDGLSLVMLILTFFLGILAVLTSWKELQYKIGFFHFNLLWVLAGITGVFLTMDLFLFYFFWEVMLIPMYLLIGIWGHENRRYAAFKFFIFTQASGLLMFVAILGLYFVHGNLT
ncbi:MAG: proton-conducting transporter membrane subunit, partial [Cyclobacteriaceae bacterium]|nr:proton-conducting transporter membrane subunit [Cyclobacteriaceae bacterium]